MTNRGTCETCAHWRELGRGAGRGVCGRIGQQGRHQTVPPSPLASVRCDGGAVALLVVGAAFGCREHEPVGKWARR